MSKITQIKIYTEEISDGRFKWWCFLPRSRNIRIESVGTVSEAWLQNQCKSFFYRHLQDYEPDFDVKKLSNKK